MRYDFGDYSLSTARGYGEGGVFDFLLYKITWMGWLYYKNAPINETFNRSSEASVINWAVNEITTHKTALKNLRTISNV